MGSRFYRQFWVFIICLLSLSTVIAQESIFSVSQATRKLELFGKKISNSQQSMQDFRLEIEEIKDLKESAEECALESQKKIKLTNSLLRDIDTENKGDKLSADLEYLEGKKAVYIEEGATCRLFAFKAQEVLSNYRDSARNFSWSQKLKRGSPFWSMFGPEKSFAVHFDNAQFYQTTGLANLLSLDPMDLITALLVILAAGVLLASGFVCWKRTAKQLSVQQQYMMNVIAIYGVFICLNGAFALLLCFALPEKSGSYSLMSFSHSFAIYLLVLLVTQLWVIAGRVRHKEKPEGLSRRMLQKKIAAITSLVFIWNTFFLVFAEQRKSENFVEYAQYVCLFITSGALYWFYRTALRPFLQQKVYSLLLMPLTTGLFFVGFGLAFCGYYYFAVFLARGVIVTAVLTITALAAIYYLNKLLSPYVESEYQAIREVRMFFGIRTHKNLYELIVLQLALDFVLLGVYMAMIMRTWNLSLDYVDAITDAMLNKISIFDFTFYPLKIVTGMIVFSVIILLGRVLAGHVSRHSKFEWEEGNQITIVSIINYISFSIALLTALLMAGVNFTGLAIIVGALSVGIGFGLQNIVNNFICGIVILLQRPVKPGDRVVVGNVEGFIRKTRVLSTQITTLLKEDVMIPNSSLIYEQVTNYTFRDKFFRVRCFVGVMYGSDIELVRNVLLEVAAENIDVMTDSPHQPLVFFSTFGDSSLNFELWCIVSDVNKKYQVLSDLNFAIDMAFRKNKIVIAFPQQDIHVRDYTATQKDLENIQV